MGHCLLRGRTYIGFTIWGCRNDVIRIYTYVYTCVCVCVFIFSIKFFKKFKTNGVNIMSPVEVYVCQSKGSSVVQVVVLRQMAQSHHLDQHWLNKHTTRNILQWKLNWNSEVLIQNMRLKMSSLKWWTFRPGLNVLALLLIIHCLHHFISEIYSLQLHSRPDAYSLGASLSLIVLVHVETHENYKVKHPVYLYVSCTAMGPHKRMVSLIEVLNVKCVWQLITKLLNKLLIYNSMAG